MKYKHKPAQQTQSTSYACMMKKNNARKSKTVVDAVSLVSTRNQVYSS